MPDEDAACGLTEEEFQIAELAARTASDVIVAKVRGGKDCVSVEAAERVVESYLLAKAALIAGRS